MIPKGYEFWLQPTTGQGKALEQNGGGGWPEIPPQITIVAGSHGGEHSGTDGIVRFVEEIRRAGGNATTDKQ